MKEERLEEKKKKKMKSRVDALLVGHGFIRQEAI